MRLAPTALVLALLLAGCLGGDDGQADADGTAPAAGTPTPEASADEAAAAEAEVVELSFVERPGVGVPPTTMAIDPAHLQIALGKPYLLRLLNEGQAPHDLVIEGLDVDTDTFAPGETLEVELLAMEAGEYAYYCSVGGDGPAGHRAQGMQGALKVA